jgi:Zn-dependent M28 family amino/carboxypeptidase
MAPVSPLADPCAGSDPACSSSVTGQGKLPADYGTYGSALALKLAASYPYRSPGSSQEAAAAEFITKSFKDLGYKPQTVPFTFKDTAGKTQHSNNIVVTIKGSGFRLTDSAGQSKTISRQVIIGAHYDAFVTEAEGLAAAKATSATTQSGTTSKKPSLADFDGIHDNASGVATLLTIARELLNGRTGYDVILVAFGAGEASQAGAKAFAATLDATAVTNTDAMYNIDGIYAGDKVYMHAGQNSVLPNDQKIYEKRRKLYEATDVFYEYELYTNNKFNLLTNQSSIEVPWGDNKKALYREWTQHISDHTPFDKLDIPIVFFESYDYDQKAIKDMKESQSPAFSSTKGAIRHTAYDSTDFLANLLNQNRTAAGTATADTQTTSVDQLTRRVNNVAFIIAEAVRKGVSGAVAQ